MPVNQSHRRCLFPAHAGMIPVGKLLAKMKATVPRTRGDDPKWYRITGIDLSCSPHTRG
mgnify:CR=1 FL=1